MTQASIPTTTIGIHFPGADTADPLRLYKQMVTQTEQPFFTVNLGVAHLFIHRPDDAEVLAELLTAAARELRYILAGTPTADQECEGCPGLFPAEQLDTVVAGLNLCPTCRSGHGAEQAAYEQAMA